jgi:hypothetical protein
VPEKKKLLKATSRAGKGGKPTGRKSGGRKNVRAKKGGK